MGSENPLLSLVTLLPATTSEQENPPLYYCGANEAAAALPNPPGCIYGNVMVSDLMVHRIVDRLSGCLLERRYPLARPRTLAEWQMHKRLSEILLPIELLLQNTARGPQVASWGSSGRTYTPYEVNGSGPNGSKTSVSRHLPKSSTLT